MKEICFRLDDSLRKEFKDFCDENNIKISVMLRRYIYSRNLIIEAFKIAMLHDLDFKMKVKRSGITENEFGKEV